MSTPTVNLRIRWYHSLPWIGPWLLRRLVTNAIIRAYAVSLTEGPLGEFFKQRPSDKRLPS